MSQNHGSELTNRDLSNINLNTTNGSPEHRREVAAQNKGAVEYAVKERERRRDDTGTEWKGRKASHTGHVPNPRPAHSHSDAKDASFFSRQAIFLILAEVVVGGLIGKVTFGGAKGVIIGAFITVVLGFLFRAWVKNIVKAEIPLPSRETLKRYANYVTLLVVSAVGVLLWLRMAKFDRSFLLAVVSNVTALALPLLSALYFELAASFSELNDLAGRYEKEDRDLAYAQEVLASINRALAGVASPEAQPASVPEGEAVAEGGMPPVGGLVPKGALLIFCLFIGMAPLASHPGLACVPLTAKVRPDTSGSPDLQVLSIATRKLQDKLLAIPCLKRIEISGFATLQDVLGGSTAGFDMPKKEKIDKEKVCGETDEETALWDDEQKRYDEQCKDKLKKIAEREAQGLRQRLSQEFSKLDFKKTSTQSCVYQAIAWALAEPRSVVPILVTDLKHERCPFPDGPIEPLFGAPPGARPVIIVVPSQGDRDPITAMDKRMKEIRQRVPTARVIPYTQIETLSVK